MSERRRGIERGRLFALCCSVEFFPPLPFLPLVSVSAVVVTVMAFCGLLPEYILASLSPARHGGTHSQENFRPPSSLLALPSSSIRSTALKAIKRHGINISKAASSAITCSSPSRLAPHFSIPHCNGRPPLSLSSWPRATTTSPPPPPPRKTSRSWRGRSEVETLQTRWRAAGGRAGEGIRGLRRTV